MASINRGSDETEALVKDSHFEGVNSFNVEADDKKVLNTVAGNVHGGNKAGVGATVAYTDIKNQSVTASLKNTSIKTADNKDKKKINVDRKSTRLNSSHANISYAVFCLQK